MSTDCSPGHDHWKDRYRWSLGTGIEGFAGQVILGGINPAGIERLLWRRATTEHVAQQENRIPQHDDSIVIDIGVLLAQRRRTTVEHVTEQVDRVAQVEVAVAVEITTGELNAHDTFKDLDAGTAGVDHRRTGTQ